MTHCLNFLLLFLESALSHYHLSILERRCLRGTTPREIAAGRDQLLPEKKVTECLQKKNATKFPYDFILF